MLYFLFDIKMDIYFDVYVVNGGIVWNIENMVIDTFIIKSYNMLAQSDRKLNNLIIMIGLHKVVYEISIQN